jgi:hypothetical protein
MYTPSLETSDRIIVRACDYRDAITQVAECCKNAAPTMCTIYMDRPATDLFCEQFAELMTAAVKQQQQLVFVSAISSETVEFLNYSTPVYVRMVTLAPHPLTKLL